MTAEEFEPLSSNANEDTGNIVIVAESIEDVYTEFLSKIIVEVSNDLFKVASNLETKNVVEDWKFLIFCSWQICQM